MSMVFFDIDGTLLPKPSLERRFVRELHWQRKIPGANYFRWLAQFVCLGVHDIFAATHANKMYLRDVPAEIAFTRGARERRGFRERCLPELFPAALERACWHAQRGDSIVLVSGTLMPLALIVKLALQRELLWRGVKTQVAVIATQLEICNGRLTGRVVGDAMFGEAKARAIREFSHAANISLEQSSAYGDSSLDRWMLAAVGHPFAVNPTARMQRIARLRGWQTLAWTRHSVAEPRTQTDEAAQLEKAAEWPQ
jgi:HAD superfamily hydrolase (TIGR01490 family)